MRKKIAATFLFVTMLLPMGSGCEAAFRDAALDGVSAFITDTIAETLEALFPIPQIVQPQAET